MHKTAFVAYNYLDLPDTIKLSEGNISYLYDATGNKLKKTFNGTVSLYQGSVLKTDGKVIVISGEERSVKEGNNA